jgi:hypothetical protein
VLSFFSSDFSNPISMGVYLKILVLLGGLILVIHVAGNYSLDIRKHEYISIIVEPCNSMSGY